MEHCVERLLSGFFPLLNCALAQAGGLEKSHNRRTWEWRETLVARAARIVRHGRRAGTQCAILEPAARRRVAAPRERQPGGRRGGFGRHDEARSGAPHRDGAINNWSVGFLQDCGAHRVV